MYYEHEYVYIILLYFVKANEAMREENMAWYVCILVSILGKYKCVKSMWTTATMCIIEGRGKPKHVYFDIIWRLCMLYACLLTLWWHPSILLQTGHCALYLSGINMCMAIKWLAPGPVLHNKTINLMSSSVMLFDLKPSYGMVLEKAAWRLPTKTDLTSF